LAAHQHIQCETAHCHLWLSASLSENYLLWQRNLLALERGRGQNHSLCHPKKDGNGLLNIKKGHKSRLAIRFAQLFNSVWQNEFSLTIRFGNSVWQNENEFNLTIRQFGSAIQFGKTNSI
jgi:hypothetical protein